MSAPQQHPTLRGTARTAIGGRVVTVPVCQCGELLLGAQAAEIGVTCRTKHCRKFWTARELRAVLEPSEPSEPPTTSEAA